MINDKSFYFYLVFLIYDVISQCNNFLYPLPIYFSRLVLISCCIVHLESNTMFLIFFFLFLIKLSSVLSGNLFTILQHFRLQKRIMCWKISLRAIIFQFAQEIDYTVSSGKITVEWTNEEKFLCWNAPILNLKGCTSIMIKANSHIVEQIAPKADPRTYLFRFRATKFSSSCWIQICVCVMILIVNKR